MHVVVLTFLVIAAVVATAFLFVFWVVVTILRGAGRLLFGPPPGASRRPVIQRPQGIGPVRACQRVSCRALNPIEARFCRRCGHGLQSPQQAAARRAAML